MQARIALWASGASTLTRVRVLAAGCAIAVLGPLALVGPAPAHGDPVTDSLLTTSIFFPPEANVSDLLVRELTDAVQRAQAHGTPVKVAIVNAPSDLGSRAGFFDRPQPFAVFVARDLSALHSGAVIVVVPGGFGFIPAAGSSQPSRSLDSIVIGPGPNGLARAAVEAVGRVADLQGTGGEGGSGGSPWRDRLAIAAAVFAAILLVGGMRLGRRRRAAAP